MMKMKLLAVLLALNVTFCFINAQDVSSIPYFCGFETEAERMEWTFAEPPGNRITTGLRVGTALKSTGNYAMYTSSDNGNTANYDLFAGSYVSIAYRKFHFENKGQYHLTFDSKILAEADYENVQVLVSLIKESLVDGSAGSAEKSINKLAREIRGFAQVGIDNKVWMTGNYYKKWSGWNSEFANMNVKEGGDYYLVFQVKVDGVGSASRLGKSARERFGVCIDNIQINKAPSWGECNSRITVFNVEKDSAGVKLSWEGRADKYDVMYYKINQPASYEVKPDTIFGIQTTEYRVNYTDIEKGVYSFRVRANCGDKTSPWALNSGVLVYDPTEYCVDYMNLKSDKTICTTGNYSDPAAKLELIDFGFESRESYHTVHWDTAEYDPVTQYKLRTVKPGAFASARIGKALDGDPQASSLVYEYNVPYDADLFLLNYAPVLQFADHHPEGEQTQIEVNILDAFTGGILETPCLHHYFNSMLLKTDMVLGKADPGWQSWMPDGYGEWCDPGEEIIWHDWMVMGFDVSRYKGQTIQVQVQLAPCAAYFHFAYIYLVPECARADISGMSCDERATELRVPEGFRYRWYKTDDPKRTVVCTENVFRPEPDDVSSYYIDMISLDHDECYFTLKAHILPRKPTPVAEYVLAPSGCDNIVKFDGSKSKINVIDGENSSAADASERISDYRWSCDYGDFTGMTPSIVVPAEGDTFNVTLTCFYAGCESSTEFTVYAPSILSPDTVIYCCSGDMIWIDGEYERFEESDTIVMSGRNRAGCDSIIIINVIKPVVVDTTVECSSDNLPYYFETELGKWGPYSVSDTYLAKVPSKIKPSCDTLHYNINFVINAMLDVQLNPMSEICSGDESFTLHYVVARGSYDTLNIRFDDLAIAAGFDDSDFSFDKSAGSITIGMPDEVRPDIYSATLIFVNKRFGSFELPIEFTVLYSKDVMVQRWNDVIALQNKEYNGGYTFSAYQWYLNGEPVEGHIFASFYTEGELLDFSGEYRMLLTRADDGKSIMTCAFTPTEFADSEYTEVSAVVFGREPIIAEVQRKSTAYLYDLAGVLHAVWNFEPGRNLMQRPSTDGIYLLKLVYEDGTVEVHKVSVR